MLIYLHGFRSGPQSEKATRLREHMSSRGLAHEFWGEQLQWSPSEAIEQVGRVIEASRTPVTLVGSSLGGHFATVLAQNYDAKAVLVNPCVLSHVTLEPYLGKQTMIYTKEVHELTREHLAQMAAQEIAHITRPERYWLLAEKGDELLDYRDAVAMYAGAKQTVLEGGNHGFTRWNEYLDEVLTFAGYAP